MPGHGPKQYPCVLCNKRTRANKRRTVSKYTRKILNRCFLIESTDGKVICNKCRHKCSSFKYKSSEVPLPSSSIQSPDRKKRVSNVQSPPSVSLPIQSTAKSHAYCVLCRKPGPRLIVVPIEARFKVYLYHNLFIPSGSRCCPSHFTNNLLDLTSLEMDTCTKEHSFVNRATIIELLEQLRKEANMKRKTRLDFDDPESMTDDDYVTLTGLRKSDFDDILTYVSFADVRPSRSRTIKTCIAVLLTKLRTSLDNKLLAVLFNMSKPQVSLSCIQNFNKYYVSN